MPASRSLPQFERGLRRRWRVIIATTATIAVVVLLNRGCGVLLGPRVAPEDVVLGHRLLRLEGLLQTPADSSVVAFERALVVIDERLVQSLLVAAIPYRGT